MKVIIGLILISASSTWDIFEAFDCEEPSKQRLGTHEKCRPAPEQTNKRKFTIIQDNKISNMTATQFTIEESRIVHYCGVYAHAKATGQNFYDMPKTIMRKNVKRPDNTNWR